MSRQLEAGLPKFRELSVISLPANTVACDMAKLGQTPYQLIAQDSAELLTSRH